MNKDELYDKRNALSCRLNELEELKLSINRISDKHEADILCDINHYEKRMGKASGKYTVQLLEELIAKSRKRKVRNEETRTEYLRLIEKEYRSTEEEIRNIESELEHED